MAGKIKSLKNGPYHVSNGVTVEDAGGGVKEFSADQTASLCRCGQSKNKPFCDGTHLKIGFQADK